MKRINILFVILMLFTACLNSSHSLEKKANSRYKEHFLSKFEGRFKSIGFDNIEVTYSGDSICVLQYTAHVENFSGKKDSQRMEYILYWTTTGPAPKLMEYTCYIDEKHRALQDELIHFDEMMGANIHKPTDDNYERALRIQVVLSHAFNHFRREVTE